MYSLFLHFIWRRGKAIEGKKLTWLSTWIDWEGFELSFPIELFLEWIWGTEKAVACLLRMSLDLGKWMTSAESHLAHVQMEVPK